MAKAAGYAGARSFSDQNLLEEELPDMLAAPGPQMFVLEIVAGDAYPRDYDYIHSAGARDTFRKALNQR
jgi:sulfopyruvate decarboxylase subunit beta